MPTVTITPANGTNILRESTFQITVSADFAWQEGAYNSCEVMLTDSVGTIGRQEYPLTTLPQTFFVDLSSFEVTDTYTRDDATGIHVQVNAATGQYSFAPATARYNLISYTACGAPTSCAVDDTLSTGDVTLSWGGATGGEGNPITGYEVQRAESTNDSAWGAWGALTTTAATSLSVSPPTTPGNYYKYRVRTLGAAGSDYYSGWKESTNTLRRDHAALAGFTDSPLVVGVTPVKALHMLELQDRINTLRGFYGLSAYAFSPIDARGIAGWTTHVNELRAAFDEIGKSHEAWIAISVNCPRADVIEQLRAVVLAA